MKISWTELRSNEEVLRMVREERCLIKQVRKRQLKILDTSLGERELKI